MVQSAQKIALPSSRDIPLDKLVLRPCNVQRAKAGVTFEELPEQIARHGLLQGLSIQHVLNADGVKTGKFEISAAVRRLQAPSVLVKQNRPAKTMAVSCVLRDVTSDILAEDDFLTGNMQRAALHALDQFRAFVALPGKGQSKEAIAAAFFVTPQIAISDLSWVGTDRSAAQLCPVCLGWHKSPAQGTRPEPRLGGGLSVL